MYIKYIRKDVKNAQCNLKDSECPKRLFMNKNDKCKRTQTQKTYQTYSNVTHVGKKKFQPVFDVSLIKTKTNYKIWYGFANNVQQAYDFVHLRLMEMAIKRSD